MKKVILILFLGILTAIVSAENWVAPTTELCPGAVVHPNPISASRWLWFDAPAVTPDTDCYYRSFLKIAENVKSVELICYFDDSGELYLNGKRVAQNSRFQQKKVPMKALNFIFTRNELKPENTLAVHVRNGKYTGGFFMLGKKHLADGKIEFFHSTPKEWKANAQAAKGWKKSDFDDHTWKAAKDFGDMLTIPWSTATDIIHLCSTPAEKAQYERENAASEKLPASLKNEPDSRIVTVWKNGLPFWKIGNKEFPPALYRIGTGSAYKCDTLHKMAYSGLPVLEYSVSTKRIEIGNGVYDFSMVDHNVKRILTLAPNAYISLNVYMNQFDNWLKQHPDEAIGYATGKADNQTTKLWRSLDVGGRPIRPSYASEPFRKEAERLAGLFCKYVKAKEWYKRVVAIRVSYGCYSEWHYYGMGGQMPDTGKAMTLAFRKYLKAKYKSDAALQKAWHNTKETLESAKVPGVQERHGSGLFLRNPATAEQKVLDYYECHQNAVADTLLAVAKRVKQEMPKVLTGAYYGYIFGMGTFPAEGQTLALERVLSSPYIDFLSSPYSYGSYARYTGGNGMFRSMPEIFRRHRKLALNEMDLRTHLTKKKEYHNAKTAQESAQIVLRDITLSALSGIGIQPLEMSPATAPGWYNAPEIYTAFHDGIAYWNTLRNNLKLYSNDLAVVFDYRELYRHGHPVAYLQQFNTMLGDYALSSLYFSGFQFDLFSMDGFLASKKNYKAVIFLNANTVSSTENHLLKAKTKNSSLIWIYAPGLVTEQGFSKDSMKNLTGFALDYRTEKLPMCMTLANGKTLGIKKLKEAPRVFVSPDEKGEILGVYEDKSMAMIFRNNSGRASVFSGIPVNDAAVWAQLLKKIGLTPCTAPGLFVKIQPPYILVHTGKAGNYTIKVPFRALKAESVFDKVAIPVNKGSVTLKSDGCKTWLLKLQ